MTRQQVRKHGRSCTKIIIGLIVILVIFVIATTAENRRQEAQRQRQKIVIRIQTAECTADLSSGIDYVLRETIHTKKSRGVEKTDIRQILAYTSDGMLKDFGGEPEGFVFYEISSEYALYGGDFPKEVQIYTYGICKQRGVSYPLIVAMIERESGYKKDCIGDDGNSKGYMQVFEKWHSGRMKEQGVTDLMNPYENIKVGIDFMAELIEKYGNEQDALTAYNYGASGAWEHLWSNGIYEYSYNTEILERAKEIEEVLEK